MLSRNNKILVGCLALLLVMSVGYALFSDTITINGTATAKGEFELTTTCDMDAEALELAQLVDVGSSSDAKISCEGNVVNASATLDYPGSQKYFRVMVTNTGTIPAKLKEVVELNNPNNVYCNTDNCVQQIENFVSNIDKTNKGYASLFADTSVWDDYATEAQGAEMLFDSEHLNSVLDPGETAYYYIKMTWSSNSTESGEPLSIPLNVQMDWEQVTE